MSDTKQMTIGITGADGMIGTHVKAYLRARGIPFIAVNRADFATSKLHKMFAESQAVIHLAGVNRGTEDEVREKNFEITEKLIAALNETRSKAHVVYSSSTHVFNDNNYGRTKKKCGELIGEAAEAQGGKFTALILPHVFGSGTKPFYNSAVGTFCYQVANGEEPSVTGNAMLELISGQTVGEVSHRAIIEKMYGTHVVPGVKITVPDVLAKIKGMAQTYANQVIPDLSEKFDLEIFNTYQSYLFPKHYPTSLQLHTSERGSLFETVKSLSGGQSFVSSAPADAVRGGHFHLRKFKRFIVLKGSATISVRRLFDETVHELRVSSDKPAYVDIPILHTYQIKNTGSGELLFMAWANEVFDPNDTDTYSEDVEKSK